MACILLGQTRLQNGVNKGVLVRKIQNLDSRVFRSKQSVVRALAVCISSASLAACTAPSGQNLEEQRVYFSHAHLNSVPHKVESTLAADNREIPRVSDDSERLVIYFDNDSARVRSEDLERLQSFVLIYPADALPLFLVTGHTDSNHSEDYNKLLSERRAISTQSALLNMGVPIHKTALRALGESVPAEPNTTDEGRQGNRRVTVYALPHQT